MYSDSPRKTKAERCLFDMVRASRIDTLRVDNHFTDSHHTPVHTVTMRFSATTLLVTALGYISAATAHTIQLKAHSRECFHEALHRDDVMTVTFQVGDREFGGSGNLEIDFWV